MAALPSFKFRLENEVPRVSAGGTAREATVSKFPASTGIAGVSMRCEPGGLRELHWHANAAEWAYVVSGTCRTTIVHPDGTQATDDFGPGDVWYFPRGYAHAIEGTGTEPCHFILVFDNGAFSENATFSLSDWLHCTPRHIVRAHLGLSDADMDRLPKGEAYIPLGPVAPAHVEATIGPSRPTALGHRFPLGAQPRTEYQGGSLRIVSRQQFPISSTMAGGLVTLKPRGVREMHWHPNADEWQYIVKGRMRMTVFASQGQSQTVELDAGDVGYVPMGYGHYLENISDGETEVLVVFNDGDWIEVGFTALLAGTAPRIVGTNLSLPPAAVAALPRTEAFFVRES